MWQLLKSIILLIIASVSIIVAADKNEIKTIALWSFDEQVGIYPSCVLSDMSGNDYSLVLGPGGQIVTGKFGNALEPIEQPDIVLPESESAPFGLVRMPVPEGRSVEPLTWYNSNFCALMTSGENHLRKEFDFTEATKSKLNIGEFNWTIEFWFYPNKTTDTDGVIFEIGTGPKAENNKITRLSLENSLSTFILFNQAAGSELKISTILKNNEWQHIAFVYDANSKTIKHYVDGKLQDVVNNVLIKQLDEGDEDYFTIGRSGKWTNPLQGKIDELRFSLGKVYEEEYETPGTFSEVVIGQQNKYVLKKGLPLLSEEVENYKGAINIGSRKHLFIDDLLLEEWGDVQFVANPPRKAECVMDNIQGPFRKHINLVEDENGLLRMYYGVGKDYLAVSVSKDGINWESPDLPNGRFDDRTNIVVHESTAMGVVFIDPNAPLEERWKYLSGYNESGVYIYVSADGYNFKRIKTAVLPFWPGSQSDIYYDEQQQKYIAHHRADFARGISGSTQREFIFTETEDVKSPWPFKPVTQQECWDLAKIKRVKDTLPFYLDNGPLTPGGFGNDYPVSFGAIDNFDPIDTDIYVAKADKYAWAPDTYIAFPTVYFHYKNSYPLTRLMLYAKECNRGSGPLETQLAVSRDGKSWKRFGRPAYVGIGEHAGKTVNTAYMVHGMIRRGNEIWQYYFGESQFHSSHINDPLGRGVYRVVQRLDGFVSIDSPYDKEVYVKTKPIKFSGNRLLLNIDTDAAGYAQVGFLDENGNDIEGFSVDDCVYINGDFIETEVEWLNKGKDVSELQGKVVQLIFRMRGSKLYAMQFETK